MKQRYNISLEYRFEVCSLLSHPTIMSHVPDECPLDLVSRHIWTDHGLGTGPGNNYFYIFSSDILHFTTFCPVSRRIYSDQWL